MVLTDGGALVIYATEMPTGFSVEFQSQGASQKQVVKFADGKKLGRAVELSVDKIELSERDPPNEDLQNMNYINRINDDGTVDEEPFWNEYVSSIECIAGH